MLEVNSKNIAVGKTIPKYYKETGDSFGFGQLQYSDFSIGEADDDINELLLWREHHKEKI